MVERDREELERKKERERERRRRRERGETERERDDLRKNPHNFSSSVKTEFHGLSQIQVFVIYYNTMILLSVTTVGS